MATLDLRELYLEIRNNFDVKSFSSEELGKITLEELANFFSKRCIDTSQDWHRKPDRNDVAKLFSLILKRDVESAEVLTDHLSANSIEELLSTIIGSDEHRSNATKDFLLASMQPDLNTCNHSNKNFILFGAYGNGNLGDAEQARWISYFLKQSGLSKEYITSTSWESRDYSYPFSERKLPFNAILDPERLCNVSMVVIGGGGLLATPHFPLHSERWLDFIIRCKVPYVLWSIGGTNAHLNDANFRAAYDSLLANASLVSARDEESYLAIRRIRSDVILLEDPVYAATIQPSQSCFDGDKVHAILKHPANDCETKFVNIMKMNYQYFMDKGLTVSFLEPSNPNERKTMADFPGCRTATTIDELDHILAGVSLGVTMRLHGAAVMARNRLKLIGVCQPKIRALLERCGIKDQFFDDGFEEILEIMRDGARNRSTKSADISPELIRRLREEQLDFARRCISLAK